MTKFLTPALSRGLSQFLYRRLPERLRLCSGIFAAGAAVASASLSGETLLHYSMSGQPGDQAITQASTVAEGVSAEELVRGAGINAAVLARGMSANAWSTVDEGIDGRQQAIGEQEYYEFSFSIAPGYVGSLSGLDHSLRRSAFNGPMYFEWQYSFDGFATPGQTIVPRGAIWDSLGWTETHFYYRGRNSGSGGVAENYNYMLGDVSDQAEGNPMPTFDLTSFGDLQDIPGGTTITFRLYGWGNANTTQTNTLALGRENAEQTGGPMLSGSVIVDPNLGDEFPLQVISEIEGTDPAPGLHSFPAGTEVTATAPAEVLEGNAVRHLPLGWTGTGSVSEGEGNSVTFTLNDASTLEWQWQRQHQLLVSAEGNGIVEVTTAERRPLLGWDFAGYVYKDVLGEGEISNADGVPTSSSAPEVQPSVIERTPVFDEESEQGLRPANLNGGGLSASMWRHTPDLATAIVREKYYEFKVTPVAGQSVTLNSLFFHYRYTQTGPHSIALLYSLDDFATYEVIESIRIQDQASGTQVASRTILFPDDPELKDVTSEVTFRIYGWGGTGSGVGTFAVRNAAVGVEDMILYGGASETTTVTASESFWLDPTDLLKVEALPDAGNIFAGWSGSLFSNRAELRGLDMRQPRVATANFAVDANGDGLPDTWKTRYFGDVETGAGDDPDDDGFTNLEEYHRGTDPTHAEELVAAGDVPLSVWENAQRDPTLPGAFIIHDFGSGFRGAWDRSNDNRSALNPFHPEGDAVTVQNNASFDGPRMMVRGDVWQEAWDNATVETVFSVGDDDGNCFYFRYQDELNWYRVSIAGQISNAASRPLQAVSIQRRLNGQYSELVPAEGPHSDPNDVSGYKRLRVRATPDGSNLNIEVSGWEASANDWQTASFGHRLFVIADDLGWGRAGFGTWAQGGAPGDTVHPDWNPVTAGTLFESFKVILNDQVVLEEDWASAPEPDEFPTGWSNPFLGVADLEGNWRVSAHGTIAEISAQGRSTSGTGEQHAADADAPTLLAPSVDLSHYVLDFGLHPFELGAIGFVFDYIDEDNYGRVLFANTIQGFDGSIPSGVVFSRKEAGAWSDLFIGDTAFTYRAGQPFHVSFMRSGSNYVMSLAEVDRPEPVHRWEWDDGSAPATGGRYGFTSWQSGDSHFLFVEAYGAVTQAVDGIAITGIEKAGETIVLSVENPSASPYQVQRTLDLATGEWETVDTEQTGATWSGPIPGGTDRAFWRLTR